MKKKHSRSNRNNNSSRNNNNNNETSKNNVGQNWTPARRSLTQNHYVIKVPITADSKNRKLEHGTQTAERGVLVGVETVLAWSTARRRSEEVQRRPQLLSARLLVKIKYGK